MWTKLAFEDLVEELPMNIDVMWDKAPSFDKYGHVNCFLTALIALSRAGGVLTDLYGHELKSIIIQPLHRKLTNKKKKWFSIIGLNEYPPTWLCMLKDLFIEVYFNNHFFYEVETTGRQFYPSASTILRCRNFLHRNYVSSPGSWGSDIAHLTYDWHGTYILEAGANGVKTTIRKNFKGYKFLPSKFKFEKNESLTKYSSVQ